MKTNILSLITAACFVCTATLCAAQDDKDRGSTDYNRQKENTEKPERKIMTKIIEYIPGKWAIESVLRGNEDVTDTDTLAETQRIEFNREGRYVRYTGTEKIDSGAYRINEEHGLLYLASETDDKPTEWKVSFNKQGEMILRMNDVGAHGESFRYIYRRTGHPSRKD